MRWTKQREKWKQNKIHTTKWNREGKKCRRKNIEWTNVFIEWYSYLALSHVATRRKIRQSDCLHGTSFSMWFWAPILTILSFFSLSIPFFFLSIPFFSRLLFVCLGLRRLNWVQILMGLMCHLFFSSFDLKTQ